MRGWCALACVVLGLGTATLAGLGTAAADDTVEVTPGDVPKPWEIGVTPDARAKANALFEQANTLFTQHADVPALEAYQAALEIWDHPMIRYNMALTLVRLDRLVEAADSLDRALRFGSEPFTDDVYARILDYQRLVTGRVGTLDVTCNHANAELSLDGKRWFTCPGKRTERVLTGEHVVLAQQSGYFAKSQHVIVVADKPTTMNIELVSIEDAFEPRRRFPVWLPGAVMGAGAVTAIAGALFWKSGSDKMHDYDELIARECSVNGCDAQMLAQFSDLRDTAIFRDKVGTVMTVVGTAAVIGGFVMLVLNRPTRHLKVDLAPTSSGGTAAATWSF